MDNIKKYKTAKLTALERRIKVLKDPGPPTDAFLRELSNLGHNNGPTLNPKQGHTEDLF